MELENNTSLEAELIHGPQGSHQHGAVVIVKDTRNMASDADEDLVWPVSRQDLETDFGTFPFDHHFPSSRMDVMVCGEAHSPGGRPSRTHRVSLQVGEFQYHQSIYGDRSWQKRGFRYQPTDPVPFTTMPLVLGRAFGGKVRLPNGEVACHENPDGKGFLVKGLDPQGQPLPNIERPEQPLSDPFGIVRPTCMAPYPLGWKLRLDPLMADGELKPFAMEDSHLYFGHAHPDLMIPRVGVGTPVRLAGMHPHQEFYLEVPEPTFAAKLAVDDEVVPLRISLTGICLFAHKGRAGFRYRAVTTFPLEPRQMRKVTLEGVPS